MLIAVLVHLPSAWGGFVWDDVIMVESSAALRSSSALEDIWLRPGTLPAEDHYQPVPYTHLWVDRQLWGDAPAGYLLVNVLVHAANAALLLGLLRHLEVPGAWFAALVFAVHPVQAQVVARIVQRKDLLSAFFFLVALGWFVRDQQRSGTDPPRTTRTVVAFVLAMLSKATAVTMPVVACLLIWWRHPERLTRSILQLAPLVAAGLAVMVIDLRTVAFAREMWGVRPPELPAVERILLVPQIMSFYPAKLLWPWPMMSLYPKWSASAWMAFACAATLAAITVALWRETKRLGRGPLAGWLIYLTMLLPVSGAIPFGFMRYSYVADRYQYLACGALIATLVAGGTLLRRRLGPGFVAACGIAVVALFVGLSGYQQWLNRDGVRLFEQNLRWNPSPAVLDALVFSLERAGRSEAATELLKAGVQQYPSSVELRNRRGSELLRTGAHEEAREQFEQALRSDPRYVLARVNMAFVLLRMGEIDASLDYFRSAVELAPANVPARYHLAKLLGQLGRRDEAVDQLRRVLQVDPRQKDARQLLSILTRP